MYPAAAPVQLREKAAEAVPMAVVGGAAPNGQDAAATATATTTAPAASASSATTAAAATATAPSRLAGLTVHRKLSEVVVGHGCG